MSIAFLISSHLMFFSLLLVHLLSLRLGHSVRGHELQSKVC